MTPNCVIRSLRRIFWSDFIQLRAEILIENRLNATHFLHHFKILFSNFLSYYRKVFQQEICNACFCFKNELYYFPTSYRLCPVACENIYYQKKKPETFQFNCAMWFLRRETIIQSATAQPGLVFPITSLSFLLRFLQRSVFSLQQKFLLNSFSMRILGVSEATCLQCYRNDQTFN